MKTSSGPAWIPVTDANKLLTACSDRQFALRDLDNMIARGGVKVQATGITSLFRNNSGSAPQPSGVVRPATWATIRAGALDAAMWKTGAVRIQPTKETTGIELSGIRLEREPFLSVLADYGSAPHSHPLTEPEKAPPLAKWAAADKGGKVNWKIRDKFWMALVGLALEGKLNIKDKPSQASLIAAIREKAEDDLYSDRVIKKYVSDFYKEFIDSGR